jgi:molybdate transport system ATP-binding protein
MSIEARFRIDRGRFTLDVDLAVPGHGVTAVFGPSGCGKTTLLRAIAGLERAPRGRVRVGEQVWQDESTFVPPHRRAIGFVFQEPRLFEHLSVCANIEYGMKRSRNAAQRKTVPDAVDLLGIGHLMDRRPGWLSGGEQQRVAIARALAVDPAMLLLDEPLAALDDARKHEILPYLESLHRDVSIPVLYVSHSRREVARLADRMLLLENGRVTAQGGVAELFGRLDLALAHHPEAGTVIRAVVGRRDEDYQLTELSFDGGRILITDGNLPRGSAQRLQISARDVSLTLNPPESTSILNVLPATVRALSPAGAAQVTVQLDVGAQTVLSRITRKSADQLELSPGKPVYAQIKSVALLT